MAFPALNWNNTSDLTPGAIPDARGRTRFVVWAPLPRSVELHILSPQERIIPMREAGGGFYVALVEEAHPGSKYFYRIDGNDRADPASRCQPEGVHGPSEVIDILRLDAGSWKGIALTDYLVYEIHVGAFTREGTLDAIIRELPRLRSLGINAIELMPLGEFPGNRNWGYDGVFPYAVHHSYGGLAALQRLVRAAHQQDMAVVLDVVYNHLGPEGNYLGQFGPYFTARYRTPWGDALNFDGPDSHAVRQYFIQNALFWIDCGIDALRLDAVHAIYDQSAIPFLTQLSEAVHQRGRDLGRHVYLIAESDLNDSRVVESVEQNGSAIDAQWSDDFHHCLHTLLTGERHGYYTDFGTLSQFGEAYRHGWVYSGQYSPYRRRNHGSSPDRLHGRQFVICSQNHDQVGNRCFGERLISLAGFEAAKLAGAAVLLAPYLPLLFMGEEYGETAPFLYFVSHSDVDLVEAVRRGRRAEFPEAMSCADFPDPQDERTFLASKLDATRIFEPAREAMAGWYAELIRLRKSCEPLRCLSKRRTSVECIETARTLLIHRSSETTTALMLLHLEAGPAAAFIHVPRGNWHKAIDSGDEQWRGPGSDLPNDINADGEPVGMVLGGFQAAVYISHGLH